MACRHQRNFYCELCKTWIKCDGKKAIFFLHAWTLHHLHLIWYLEDWIRAERFTKLLPQVNDFGASKRILTKKKKKCFRQTQLVEQPEPFYWCYMTFEYTELKTSQKERKIGSRKCQNLNRLSRWKLQRKLNFAELNGITTFEDWHGDNGVTISGTSHMLSLP